jgi:SAM-dependent methyltransferase
VKVQPFISRWQRAWNILRVQGIRRFLSAGTDWLRFRMGRPSSRRAEYVEKKQRADRKFDAEVGVTTGGVAYLYDLTIAGPNARFGTNHVATDPTEFELAMAHIDIDVPSATFVDLGSGKGRSLILAARYKFQRIIGVEFARELHEICVDNIQRAFPAPADAERITPILGDAADFAYPDQPLVLYLFNPFDAPVMAAAARHAFASWQAHPRPIRVVYLNPVFGKEWTNAGWEVLTGGIGWTIFAPPAR